ncbi:hypothetical protein QJS04_geneDACA023681 [Acorus gramineus]|uniref:SOSEKI DIX-like domain-containing protein n=1 Tax=Acorus gramineus TaxID=55184 RepID=A0AAV9B3V6_ACOGR|nr:hypothetical protein QJS04_geneDACA023681 [Acorus gramineus]
MAMASRAKSELQRQWRERETSPERTRIWTEPPKSRPPPPSENKVPVVYYLSRNGNLEHPHFMEISLSSSSSDGLYMRDVMNRLNFLRGKGMANMYAWSSKRSYKNGFVWHDLSEDDFIYPVHGHEYVLKGSELLIDPSSAVRSIDSISSSSSERLPPPPQAADVPDFPLPRRKKQPSWTSLDLNEYKVCKPEPTTESAAAAVRAVAADASTQTDDRKQQRRRASAKESLEPPPASEELCGDEISPPPSSSSPETLESLIKSDGRLLISTVNGEDRTVNNLPSGRVRASAVLMHLISCGSFSVKDSGFSMVSHYRARLPRGSIGGGPSDQAGKDLDGLMDGTPVFRLEDKVYFSGSLIETKKKGSDGLAEFPSLKRSSSYNAERSSKMEELMEEEIDSVRAKCLPRKTKSTVRKEGCAISRSAHMSKRITDEPPK